MYTFPLDFVTGRHVSQYPVVSRVASPVYSCTVARPIVHLVCKSFDRSVLCFVLRVQFELSTKPFCPDSDSTYTHAEFCCDPRVDEPQNVETLKSHDPIVRRDLPKRQLTASICCSSGKITAEVLRRDVARRCCRLATTHRRLAPVRSTGAAP